MKKKKIKRGDIFYADLDPVVGSEQGGHRPVLIIQNDMGNNHSGTTIAAPITSNIAKSYLPVHSFIPKNLSGLPDNSYVLLEQIRTLDKSRISDKAGHLHDLKMDEINDVIKFSLDLDKKRRNKKRCRKKKR